MTEASLQPAWLDAQAKRDGRYVIGPLLGHGGMGEVYEAWDVVLARPVALKILRHLEPAAMIRFMHEAQLHARLDCPNICRIYDVEATGGTPRIAMQLVRGPNLEDAAADLELGEILDIIILVAEALTCAHRLKLIHRDIKPSNILLQKAEDGSWVPFICDFGLAMAMDGPSVTQPLAMTGTPAYMAPEQVRGDRSLICPATDVYGIGSTLYFTLTGRPPCVSTVTAEVLRVKKERRFPSPRSLEPQIPPDLESILLKCLQPAPEDRYPSTAALAADLRRFRSGQAVLAQPQSRAHRLWRRCRRHGSLLASAGIALALAMGLVARDRSLQRQSARQADLGRFFALEAANLEQNLRIERLLPVHDLRPAYGQTRGRMEALRGRSEAMGVEAQGPLHYALGRAQLSLGDPQTALGELEQAWALGFQTADSAFLLGRLQAWADRQARDLAAFEQRPAPADSQHTRAEELLRRATGLNADPQEYADATLAFHQGRYAQAAEWARASLAGNPWHLESATLACASLSALARERAEQGDPAAAQQGFQEALALAQANLARGQSEEGLHHAQAEAALGLAALALERGDLTMAAFELLERQTQDALKLNPEAADAQSDWLRVRCLKVMRMLDLELDPRPVLDEALQFYWTRTREPRSVALRVDHMVLYLQQANWQFSHGQDPGPALAEALRDAGPARYRHRDFYGDLLNFKARLERARGQDPRPTLDLLLKAFEPLADTGGIYFHCEIAAEAWMTRAQWEQDQGQDPSASLRRAQALLQRALRGKPTSATAHALLGQTQVLEAALHPDQRQWLRARAQEQLRFAQGLNRNDGHIARLQAGLARLKK